MKKKWLAITVWTVLMLIALTGLKGYETEQLLARALTATGGAGSEETLMALATVAMNRAGGTSLEEMTRALDAGGFSRGYEVRARALAVARRAIAGERTLPEGVTAFCAQKPDQPFTKEGAFYFY